MAQVVLSYRITADSELSYSSALNIFAKPFTQVGVARFAVFHRNLMLNLNQQREVNWTNQSGTGELT